MGILKVLGFIDRAPNDRIIQLTGTPVTKRKTKKQKQQEQLLKDQTDAATGNPPH